MPSWPTVVLGAVIVGAVIGAVQNAEDPAADAGAEGFETAEAPTPRPTPPAGHARDADPSGWPAGIASTLPADGDVRIALTFDDGPHPTWTPQILDTLARHDATATFCVVGTQATGREAILARIHAEGHALCNHSMTHPSDLGSWPRSDVEAELEQLNRLLEQSVPEADVTSFRAPGGQFTPTLVSHARDLGLDSWAWSVDARDWTTRSSETIVTRMLDDVAPGSVILLHDGGGDRSATVQALDELLPVLSAAGYTFVALPDLS